MAVRATTVHENSVSVLKQLRQLSQFCQLEDIIDLYDQTLMLL
jgi:hypothetical protein